MEKALRPTSSPISIVVDELDWIERMCVCVSLKCVSLQVFPSCSLVLADCLYGHKRREFVEEVATLWGLHAETSVAISSPSSYSGGGAIWCPTISAIASSVWHVHHETLAVAPCSSEEKYVKDAQAGSELGRFWPFLFFMWGFWAL